MLIIATHVPMRGLDIRHMTFYSKSCALCLHKRHVPYVSIRDIRHIVQSHQSLFNI